MPQHLVEEDGRGASAQDRRAAEGLGDGRNPQGFEVLGHHQRLVDDGLLIRQPAQFVALKCLDAVQIHAVRGAGAAYDDEPRDVVWGAHAGALARNEIIHLVRGLQPDIVVEDVRKLLEQAGDLAQPALPLGLIGHQRRGARHELGIHRNQRRRRRFLREVGRGILFLGPNLLLRLHLQKAVERLAITAIGGVPEASRQRLAIVR